MEITDEITPLTWRLLGYSAIFLFLLVIGGIFLISAGVTDPKPLGELQLRLSPGVKLIGAGSDSLLWQESAAVSGSYSIKLIAAHQSGEEDIGSGLVVGSPDGYLVAAVSPLGLVSLWSGQTETNDPSGCNCRQTQAQELIPWQPWPHVHHGQEPNEIWIDVRNGQATSVRMNRELLWKGEAPLAGGQAALWLASFGKWASVDFQELSIYYER